jgi:prepilin-type processing-associated H-X9-DG protein
MVYKCPADLVIPPDNYSFGAAYPHVRSISMNDWLSPFTPPNNITTIESYYRDSDLVRPGPSQLFVFIDESPLSINDGYFFTQPGTGTWVDLPASYHNDGSGLSFADGHAVIKRWTDRAIFSGNPESQAPQQNPPLDLDFLLNAASYLK